MSILKAPYSGVVTARNYDSGDLYKIWETLSQPSTTFNPSKSYVPCIGRTLQVKMGMNVKVKWMYILARPSTERYLDISYHGCHHTHLPGRNNHCQRNRKVRPGMFYAPLSIWETKHVLVPDVAIPNRWLRATISSHLQRRYRKLQRELGRLVGDRYEIISGVPDGAYVCDIRHQN